VVSSLHQGQGRGSFTQTDFVLVLLADKTQIAAQLDGDNLIVTAAGPAYTLVECGEQLAWIAASMWPPTQNSVVYHTPAIVQQHSRHDHRTLGSSPVCFDIVVEQSPVPPAEDYWSDVMGLDFAVVRGFPLPRRPERQPWLESSFEILRMEGYQLSSTLPREVCLQHLSISGPQPMLSHLPTCPQWTPRPLRPLLQWSRDPEHILALVKRRDSEFLWGHVGCFRHGCWAVDDSDSRLDEKGPIHPTELMSGRHIIIGCGNISTREDMDAMSNNVPSDNGARPGASDVDADPSGSSERSELDLSADRQALLLSVEPPDGTSSPDGAPVSLTDSCQPPYLTDSSFESDLLSMSDSFESISLFDRGNPALPFLRAAIVRCLISDYQAYIKSTTSGNQDTGPTSWGTASGSASSRPSGSSEKKRRQQTSGNGDEPPSKKPLHKRAKRSGSMETPKKNFACPFAKAHPSKHGCCFSKVLSRIRDVKQHLDRSHYPKFYCGRCSMIFPDEESYQQHVANPAGLFCPPSAQLDGITHEQRRQISRKSNPKFSVEQQWFALWDIVFPGRPPPASPYQDANVSEELWSFRTHWEIYSESILEREAQAMVDTGRWPGFQRLSAEERQSILRWLARRGFEHAWGEFISTRPPVAGQSNIDEAMSAQYATPSGTSQPDSGIAVDTLTHPPASVSRLNDIVEGVTGYSSEEGSSSGVQGVMTDERTGPMPSTGGDVHGSRPGDDESLSYDGYAPGTWDWNLPGLDPEELDRILADVDGL